MLKTSTFRVRGSELTVKDQKLHVVFDSRFATSFTCGVSFDLKSQSDLHELNQLMNLTGVLGEGWQSHFKNKKVRLILDFEKTSRSGHTIEIKAIGHPTDDLFFVLNSGMQFLTEASALEYIAQNS